MVFNSLIKVLTNRNSSKYCCQIYTKKTRSYNTSAHLRRPKLCIVGSGPAGFYTAQHVLKGNKDVTIDIVDKLPVPFGLVRFGVAPDHPEVKNVINTFTQTMDRFSDRCNFIGNLEVGRQISLEELRSLYDAIVLCNGAECDRKLGIPGEDVNGVYSAREFVGWYNGLPEFQNFTPNLNSDTAVILGQGNVALDIARVLLMPIDDLATTDICDHALQTIAKSRIRSVQIIGRRGPLQAAFTIKELRELTKLENVRADISLDDLKNLDMTGLTRPRKRITELMQKTAENTVNSESERCWSLRFLLSPIEIMTNTDGQRLSGVKFNQNTLQGNERLSQKAVPTEYTTDIPCGVVFRSIGYESLPIDVHSNVPFDQQSKTLPNVAGRVKNCPDIYCSGWIKRGPIGVIASTMTDAFETADSILEDIKSGHLVRKKAETCGTSGEFYEKISGQPVVSFSGWKKIDAEEVIRGSKVNKPREKITSVTEMLEIAKL